MARRVRWYSLSSPTMCLVFGLFCPFWFQLARADCYYDDEKYEEGVEVETFEHCLNCTCTRGVLLCYLRICPKLPNPPPVGCILLHRYRTCCPELICTDLPGNGNFLEGRSDPDGLDLLQLEEGSNSEACIANGSIYSPGSAMDSSSLCEYCYCLRGTQTCVKPKCLLPIEGCTPAYDPFQCCPVQYNCSLPQISSTTTTAVPLVTSKGGCFIDNEFYPEGGKVLGIGHSVCDNCYCLRGMLRCEPLSCAPPLLGCKPIVRAGECCAASYNCTGSIEINPEPNYGQFPIVSKEYSKLRKEQSKHPISLLMNTGNEKRKYQSDDPFYVIAESAKSNSKVQRNPETSGTTRQITGSYFNPSTTTPFYYKSMIKEGMATNGYKHFTRSYPESKFSYTILNDNFDNRKEVKPAITLEFKSDTPTTTNLIEPTSTADLQITGDIYTNAINTDRTQTTESDNHDTNPTFESETETTTIPDEELHTTDDDNESGSSEESVISTIDFQSNDSEVTTIRSVLNTTDCTDNFQSRQDFNLLERSTILPVAAEKINDLSEINEFTPSAEISSSEATRTDDITEVDLQTSFTLEEDISPKIKNGSKITSLLNGSKTEENDYDFDYNKPSLPPSLPNLHIIPFLAADALDTEKETKDAGVAREKTKNISHNLANFFSPPIKTEGGFVPNSNPMVMETMYDNAVTVPSIINPPGTLEGSCLSEGNKVGHRQSVASDSPCMTCNCLYGNIVCQKAPCPILGPNCRKAVDDPTLCCPLYVCDDDGKNPISSGNIGASQQFFLKTYAGRNTTPNPFRDVIKTEPAPDLQSLMDDMLPHLNKKPEKESQMYYITTLRPATSEIKEEKPTEKKEDSLYIDKLLAFLLGGGDSANETSLPLLSTKENTVVSESTIHKDELGYTKLSDQVTEKPSSSAGILKLAGCNIYGRMYRVGRIISELSGPCLECKCTETGVQCQPLKC